MIKKKLFSLLILAFLGTIDPLYAEIIPIETAEHHLMHKVIENHEYCVAAFDEDKIFIRPENIISTNRGLFINLNGSQLYPLPLLQFGKRGHFIQGSLMQSVELAAAAKKKGDTKGPCPNCDVNTDKNGVCKNSECFFYGLRVL